MANVTGQGVQNNAGVIQANTNNNAGGNNSNAFNMAQFQNFLSGLMTGSQGAPNTTGYAFQPNTGLFGLGTSNQWTQGLGVANSLMGLGNYMLAKDQLDEQKKFNNANLQLANINNQMKYDALMPEYLKAQGQAQAVGDWVATQGGNAAKYQDIANLALPNRPQTIG